MKDTATSQDPNTIGHQVHPNKVQPMASIMPVQESAA
jgi:hypothetical protein